jgi:hypothetical protein
MFKEASWDAAPGLTEGALNIDLSAERCNLDYWIRAAAQGTWQGLVNGHRPGAETPPYMREPGPLRDAMIEEKGFRSIGEELATRALSYLVVHAPDVATMEFYVTQAVDEARHASVFRGHLYEIGVPPDELPKVLASYVGDQVEAVLKPLERWILNVVRDRADFIGGVAIFTILVEGVLAPAAEISERKWRLVDPAAAQIAHGANIDEIRHLTVGASIVREHLLRHPADKPRLLELIRAGREEWDRLPTEAIVLHREELFQQGLADLRPRLGDYELVPGRRLVDTTPDERLEIAETLSETMQDGRLRYMGLEEAIRRGRK